MPGSYRTSTSSQQCLHELSARPDHLEVHWYNGAAQLMLQGALFWSPETHKLFALPARTRAVQLLMLSYHMVVPIPLDLWVVSIIPHVLGPAIEWGEHTFR